MVLALLAGGPGADARPVAGSSPQTGTLDIGGNDPFGPLLLRLVCTATDPAIAPPVVLHVEGAARTISPSPACRP